MIAGILFLLFIGPEVMAQCSICTKVAADQRADTIKGLNAGILYLLAIPLSVVGFIGYRFYKSNAEEEDEAEPKG
jgi:hypothetical protein